MHYTDHETQRRALARRLGFRKLLTFGIHIHAIAKHEKRALNSVKAYANTVTPEHKYKLNILGLGNVSLALTLKLNTKQTSHKKWQCRKNDKHTVPT